MFAGHEAVIVDFARIQGYEERREGAYARDELNIHANAPSPLLSKSSVQKGGGAYFRELTVMQKIVMVHPVNVHKVC